jgi:hypothetical protein
MTVYGGGFEGGDEVWIGYLACDGQGYIETEIEPITLEDMDDAFR